MTKFTPLNKVLLVHRVNSQRKPGFNSKDTRLWLMRALICLPYYFPITPKPGFPFFVGNSSHNPGEKWRSRPDSSSSPTLMVPGHSLPPTCAPMWQPTAATSQMSPSLHEIRAALALLARLNAPLKLVVAGNHDFTLDKPVFRTKAVQAEQVLGVDPD